MTIHLPSAFRLGRLLMSLLHAVQSKITEASASNSTAAKNMSFYVASLINGGVMFVLLLGGLTPAIGQTASFSNASAITIPDSGAGTPYPSTINVSGTAGTISQVMVRLDGYTHTYPDDLDVLLVSPTGQKVIVMSDVGGGNDVNNVSLTLSDGAAAALPDSGQIVSGTFKPTNIGTGDTFPAPAPGGPYGATLSMFNGVSANGVWSLFVVADAAVDQGAFSGGWTLTIA